MGLPKTLSVIENSNAAMAKVAFFYSNNDKRVGHPDIKHLQEEERREKGQPEGLY